MKSRNGVANAYAHESVHEPGHTPAPPRAGSDVRLEDLGDGSALVSLRLPWALALEMLDLARVVVEPARSPAS